MLDIHIGFMDEEVKPVLEQMMRFNKDEDTPAEKYGNHVEKSGEYSLLFRLAFSRLMLLHRERPIIVIERNAVTDSAILFEKVQSEYALKSWEHGATVRLSSGDTAMYSNPPSNRGAGLEYIGKIAAGLSAAVKESKTAEKVATRKNADAKIKSDLGDLAYTVLGYKLDKLGSDVDPLVIVRAPEMGLQPDLIRVHLRTILRGLGLAIEKKGAADINITVYGAGGAQVPHTRPGELRYTWGSFYVGVEHNKATTGPHDKWKGIIAYATPEEHVELFSEVGEKAKDTLAKAKTAFLKNEEVDAKIRGICEAFKKSSRSKTGYTLSLTASFFIPGDFKAAANQKGIDGDVAMEDYHLLKVIHSIKKDMTQTSGVHKYPSLGSSTVMRIDCDPPEIDQDVFNKFAKWALDYRWTRQHYISAIIWGLQGLELSKIDWNYADWTFPRDHIKSDASLRKHFFIVEQDGAKRVLCPFYTEVACDLLESIRKAKNAAELNDVFLVHLRDKDGKPLPLTTMSYVTQYYPAMKDLAEKIKKGASAGLSAPDSREGEALRQNIDKLVTLMGAIYIMHRQVRKEDGGWPIWARPGWGAYRHGEFATVCPSINRADAQTRIKAIWCDGANGNLDRAFYKSTNMVALQIEAIRGIGGQVGLREHTQKWSGVMQELKGKAQEIQDRGPLRAQAGEQARMNTIRSGIMARLLELERTDPVMRLLRQAAREMWQRQQTQSTALVVYTGNQ
ncbi:hypothetical protein NR798_11005 [Archangium gephyra]|uniref:hypothetical protein n=1 Tax=Archangium gephyra TaxID=48 RepID=UPI0035D4289D